jgi:anti-sigma factor RsiW
MTPCQRLKQNLFNLLDADVEHQEKKRLEGHIQSCPDCSDFYMKLKRQKAFLKGLRPIRTRDHFIILLRDRIRRDLAGKPASTGWFSLKWAVGFAAAALAAAALFRFSGHAFLKNGPSASSAVEQPALSASVRPVPDSKQFVLDDFNASSRRRSAQPKRAAAPDDTAQTDSSGFEELRSRLTPVSF